MGGGDKWEERGLILLCSNLGNGTYTTWSVFRLRNRRQGVKTEELSSGCSE